MVYFVMWQRSCAYDDDDDEKKLVGVWNMRSWVIMTQI